LSAAATRTAKYLGSQGCVTLPLGQNTVNFTPAAVKSRLPDPATQPWPMGHVVPDQPLPPTIDAAFDPPEGMTAAFVVTWKGRIIAERYGEGVTISTPLEGWSMGKSITASLIGILLKEASTSSISRRPFPNGKCPVTRAPS
jgi:CubicO group peptidase (beta-lactamase class C family)